MFIKSWKMFEEYFGQAKKETKKISPPPQLEFLAHLSHEIRNPLYGIVGTASLLAKTDLTEEQSFYVKTLESSSRALMGMVDEVLDYSKFSQGILEFHPCNFQLQELSEEIMSLYMEVAKAKNIRLECSISENVHDGFFGDPERIRQVLMNLISNGIKYTESGCVHLRWKVLEDSNNYQSIRCEVEDTGRGIALEAQECVFKPFFRIDPSFRVPGTGLGLSISKMIIEKMQGRIGLKSANQKGTTFWFELVLSKRIAPKELEKVSQAGPQQIDLSYFKVLVAEDNAINQSILGRMFDKMGLRYKVVSEGSAVLSTLMEERFDMVLMDCYMTPMDGFETARNIRSSKESFRNIPLLAFTASSVLEDRKRCFEAGMNDVLLKPTTFDQLKEKMLHWAHTIYEALPVLDESSIEKIRLFDDEEQTLLKSLLEIYSESTPEELRLIKELIEDENIEAVRKKAHKLRSGAAQLGALRFEKLCNLMEFEPELDRERAAQLYLQMREEYERSHKFFQNYCTKHSQKPPVLM